LSAIAHAQYVYSCFRPLRLGSKAGVYIAATINGNDVFDDNKFYMGVNQECRQLRGLKQEYIIAAKGVRSTLRRSTGV